MSRRRDGGLGSALAWFLFPLVPAFLGRTYHETCNLELPPPGSDPREWSWLGWAVLAGPLLGYGFLAGATLNLPDDPERTGPRSWRSSRALWVSVGPWLGFLVFLAVRRAFLWIAALIDRYLPHAREPAPPWFASWYGTWKGVALCWVVVIALVGAIAYGWLPVAIAAIRRARRMGRARRAIERGVAGAVAFVGSLFGSFWAITEVWRSHFFDSRIVPLFLAAATLAIASGCGSTMTYGELRRRELFSAMLTAWLLGLAFVWRWVSRKGNRP